MTDPTTYPGDLVLRAGKACAVLRPDAGGRVCSLTLARDDGRTVDVLFPYTAQGVDPLRWGKGGCFALRTRAGPVVVFLAHFRGEACWGLSAACWKASGFDIAAAATDARAASEATSSSGNA